MTQKEVIEQLKWIGGKMPRSMLANIETGHRNIKASDLKILFNVEYEEFFKD